MKKLFISLMLIAPTTLFAQKFGHANFQEIMTTMPEYIQAEADIKKVTSQKEEELKTMQKEFQTKYEDYQKNERTMNASMQQEKIQPIMDKLAQAIKNVGAAGGYVYIMDSGSTINYINDSISKDVSAEVKNELKKMK